ncbi:unnamed protein product [Caenorhabditis sp. 36 PRJEB53466]|nr:unnamed protein product [Caenorhabditis sp. 36 PRJEB53466]
MDDGRRLAHDDFQLAGQSISGASSSSHNTQRSGDVLQPQFSRDDAVTKETQYILLQLISMVRDNPVLYDEDLQATISDAELKQQKKDAWTRIRTDMMWQDMTSVQDVWSEIFEQYARKSEDLTESLLEAMRWTDPILNKKKSDSRPPSQLNNMSSSLEKDYFADVPLAEDVLVSGQSMESPTSSLNMLREYVVIQPARRMEDVEVHHGRPSHESVQQCSTSYSRRKSPPRETEAIVRTYPLSLKRGNATRPEQQMPSVEQKLSKRLLGDAKKEYKGDHPSTQMSFNRHNVLVDVEHSFPPSTSKMFKVTSPQATTSVTSTKRLGGVMHRGNSLNYESVPPEPLIETPDSPTEQPPKKKIVLNVDSDLRHHRNLPIVCSSSSGHLPKTRVDECSMPTVLLSGTSASDKILSDGVPIADDEIILEATGECKPLVGSSGLMIGGPSGRSAAQQLRSPTSHEHSSNMPCTSGDAIHHYHHPEIEEGNVEDIGEQVVVDGQTDDMAIQYDEDLAFQQHINSVLNRLTDDDKTVMKFNLQKIILDARFGAGTARSMLKHDQMLEQHIEIDQHQETSDTSL